MNYIKLASRLIIIGLVFLIVYGIYTFYKANYYGYEYLTMNDEFGIASKCYMNDKGLFCKTDKGLVEVKQFRKR